MVRFSPQRRGKREVITACYVGWVKWDIEKLGWREIPHGQWDILRLNIYYKEFFERRVSETQPK